MTKLVPNNYISLFSSKNYDIFFVDKNTEIMHNIYIAKERFGEITPKGISIRRKSDY